MKTFYTAGIVLIYFAWILSIILKACNVLTWSWTLILIPVWIPLSAIVFFLSVFCIMAFYFFCKTIIK